MKNRAIYNILAVSGVIVSTIILLISWSQLPETVPAHFNIAGEADYFAPKWVLIFIPLFCLGLFFLISLMISKPQIVTNYPYTITPETKDRHYEIIRNMGRWLRVWIIWSFVYIEFVFINSSVNWISLSGLTILIPIAITIIGVILIMRKGKRI